MPGADYIAIKQERSTDRIRAVLKKRGSKETQARIKELEDFPLGRSSVRGGVVNPADEFLAIFADDMADLAELVDGLLETRGRPRNITFGPVKPKAKPKAKATKDTKNAKDKGE